ncbi:hypothetical protein LSTR_LSTR012140 [Laodelphax striatellus]|uniref:Uncharacterized protein n=1 Tax=Laodelphax striatellus TaxID=195883 RepID=A0A482XL36_LAOST|nr:hypothetical protein LSTR_LSTR012140 [Laodelphax striatellus]
MSAMQQQLASVKDLKSRFEQIKMNKLNSDLDKCQKYSQNGVVDEHNFDEIISCDVPDGQDLDLKVSNLSIGDSSDQRRKSGKKKNVTFCEQVVLVATAEEDEVDGYIPNPILERVLRSVLHKDAPQENREIAVQSVVPLKRTDSINSGQKSPSWSTKEPNKTDECQNKFFEDITKDVKVNGESNSIRNFINANLKSISSNNQQQPSGDSRPAVVGKSCLQQPQQQYNQLQPQPMHSQLQSQQHNQLQNQQINQLQSQQHSQIQNQQHNSQLLHHNLLQPQQMHSQQHNQLQSQQHNQLQSQQHNQLQSQQHNQLQSQQHNQLLSQQHNQLQSQQYNQLQSQQHNQLQSQQHNQLQSQQHNQLQSQQHNQQQQYNQQQYQQNGLQKIHPSPLLNRQPTTCGINYKNQQQFSNQQQSPINCSTNPFANGSGQSNVSQMQQESSNPDINQHANYSGQQFDGNQSLHPHQNIIHRPPQSPNHQPYQYVHTIHQQMHQSQPTTQYHQMNGCQQAKGISHNSPISSQNPLYSQTVGLPQQSPVMSRPQANVCHAELRKMNSQPMLQPQNANQHQSLYDTNVQSVGIPHHQVPTSHQPLRPTNSCGNMENSTKPATNGLPQQSLVRNGRPQAMYQQDLSPPEYQHPPPPKQSQPRSEIYQRVPNPVPNTCGVPEQSYHQRYAPQNNVHNQPITNQLSHTNASQMSPNYASQNGGCYYQQYDSTQNSSPAYNQNTTMNFPVSTSQPQPAPVKCHPPYQHPPPPKNMSENNKVTNNLPAMNHLRTTPCHLCRKKQVIAPSIYCTDCDFYMSRFKVKS